MKATHTSTQNFSEFDAAFIGSSTGHTGICAGFFFSQSLAHTSHVAEGSEGWITYEVELSIENPATCASYDEAAERFGDGEEAVANLKAAGHDALILAGGDEIVVWDTSKILIISKKP
jgi:hypothetical protein